MVQLYNNAPKATILPETELANTYGACKRSLAAAAAAAAEAAAAAAAATAAATAA